jgi:hypothetical protein
MQSIGHLLTFTQLKLKVTKITQQRITLFKNGTPRWGWFKWFKKHILDLSLKVTHGLEVGCAKGLCPKNVASFYINLIKIYNAHTY